MKSVKTMAGLTVAAIGVIASPVAAKGIAPLAQNCALTAAKGFTACPVAKDHVPARADRVRFTVSPVSGASVSADGRRELNQLIASLN